MKAFKKIRDNLLVERVRNGDQDAFAIIYDQYNEKIFRYVYFKVSNQQLAEDLTSDIFIKAWEYITATPRSIDNLQALLYSIARNLVIDYYRTRAETYQLDESRLPPDSQSERASELVGLNEDLRLLVKQMSQLADEYNEIITLRYIEDYSVREIASLLGKTENNVRVTLHRALQALKQIVNNNE